MDPPFSGFVLDPSKCHKMNITEKRELVHELSKWPESAPEKLQTWSRQDILEILCAEIGKERKYTGLKKQKMIEYLVKVVSEKKLGERGEKREATPNQRTPSTQAPSKRQRKSDNPSRLPILTSILPGTNNIDAVAATKYCQNLACRAILKLEDTFCRRCSCCICHKYDDNKDPSLWLFCSSEIPPQGNSCGLSCHLECALKHERAGIVKNGSCKRLDGAYFCTYCGKENDLLGCWKKQLMIAKDARRVDVLCYRISLSHKLLSLTKKYQNLHGIVDTAMKKLEAEIGPINGMPAMARGIVNRLSVGSEVQRLCASAVESLESMLSIAVPADPPVDEATLSPTCFIKFEDILPTSLTMVLNSEAYATLSEEVAGFNLWHRKADIADYPSEPTCTVQNPKKRFLVTKLSPATEYVFKVVGFGNSKEFGPWEAGVRTNSFLKNGFKALAQGETRIMLQCRSPKTNSSSLSNPSEGDKTNNNTIAYADLNKSPESDPGYCENPEIVFPGKLSDQHCKPTNHSENTDNGTISGTEGAGQEETPGISGSALDDGLDSTILLGSHRDSANSVEQNGLSKIPKLGNESNEPIGNEMVIVPYSHSDSTLPVTPCKLENGKDSFGKSSTVKSASNVLENGTGNPEGEPGSSSKQRTIGNLEEICNKDGSSEGAYEYCVKVIRWLERDGHIETNFRVKFLTWFSLRANPQERRVVSVYVDTLIDDPASLAGQLVDTFSDAIYSKRPPPVPTGFCVKLWH